MGEDGTVHVGAEVPEWDEHFTPPEYLYSIILVCMFFGFILFLIFFALVRYLRWQNKQRAILQTQLDREAAQFPVGIDGQLLCPDDPAAEEISLHDYAKACATCQGKGEESCVCRPLPINPTELPSSPPQEV